MKRYVSGVRKGDPIRATWLDRVGKSSNRSENIPVGGTGIANEAGTGTFAEFAGVLLAVRMLFHVVPTTATEGQDESEQDNAAILLWDGSTYEDSGKTMLVWAVDLPLVKGRIVNVTYSQVNGRWEPIPPGTLEIVRVPGASTDQGDGRYAGFLQEYGSTGLTATDGEAIWVKSLNSSPPTSGSWLARLAGYKSDRPVYQALPTPTAAINVGNTWTDTRPSPVNGTYGSIPWSNVSTVIFPQVDTSTLGREHGGVRVIQDGSDTTKVYVVPTFAIGNISPTPPVSAPATAYGFCDGLVAVTSTGVQIRASADDIASLRGGTAYISLVDATLSATGVASAYSPTPVPGVTDFFNADLMQYLGNGIKCFQGVYVGEFTTKADIIAHSTYDIPSGSNVVPGFSLFTTSPIYVSGPSATGPTVLEIMGRNGSVKALVGNITMSSIGPVQGTAATQLGGGIFITACPNRDHPSDATGSTLKIWAASADSSAPGRVDLTTHGGDGAYYIEGNKGLTDAAVDPGATLNVKGGLIIGVTGPMRAGKRRWGGLSVQAAQKRRQRGRA